MNRGLIPNVKKNKNKEEESMCICDGRQVRWVRLTNWFQPKHFLTWTWNSAWICCSSAINHFLQLSMCIVYTAHSEAQNIVVQKIGKLFIAINFLFHPHSDSSWFLHSSEVSYRSQYYLDYNHNKSCSCLCKWIFSLEK